jgi:uncharacterized protein YrzB (UPF0473 family)
VEEKTTIKILDESGNLIERKILFTFECEELNKNYVAYEGNLNKEICVASYNPDVDLNKLEPVTDEEELKMVNDVLNQIMEEN